MIAKNNLYVCNMKDFNMQRARFKNMLKELGMNQREFSKLTNRKPDSLDRSIAGAKVRGEFPPSLVGIVNLFELITKNGFKHRFLDDYEAIKNTYKSLQLDAQRGDNANEYINTLLDAYSKCEEIFSSVYKTVNAHDS